MIFSSQGITGSFPLRRWNCLPLAESWLSDSGAGLALAIFAHRLHTSIQSSQFFHSTRAAWPANPMTQVVKVLIRFWSPYRVFL